MYTAEQVREIFENPISKWPEDFLNYVNNIFASELLDQWIYSHSDKDYREKVKEIIEDIVDEEI